MEIARFFNIRPIMDKAFSDGQLKLARDLALEYLELAKDEMDSWNYGNAIHHSNLVLGRIALSEQNILRANEYLIAAGRTPGSPQLNSFGPNMSLAKELVEHGEIEAVIDYINLSKKYWKWFFSWWKIRKWKRQIKKGLIPDFGANLYH